MKLIGTALILCGLLGLYGWVNYMEPDCFYSDKVGLQIRLCGESFSERKGSANLWVPAVLFSILGAGILLRFRSSGAEAARAD